MSFSSKVLVLCLFTYNQVLNFYDIVFKSKISLNSKVLPIPVREKFALRNQMYMNLLLYQISDFIFTHSSFELPLNKIKTVRMEGDLHFQDCI